MASHATAARRKDRNPNFPRPWGPTRSGGPTSYAVNGSPHSGRRREHQHPQQQHQHHRQQQQQQQQQYHQQQYQQQQASMSDHDQYKHYLMSGWEKIRRQIGSDHLTIFAARNQIEEPQDFVPVNLDECIAQAYQQAKSEN